MKDIIGILSTRVSKGRQFHSLKIPRKPLVLPSILQNRHQILTVPIHIQYPSQQLIWYPLVTTANTFFVAAAMLSVSMTVMP